MEWRMLLILERRMQFFDLIDINGTENAKTTFMDSLLFETRLQRYLWALLAAILSNLDKILLHAQF